MLFSSTLQYDIKMILRAPNSEREEIVMMMTFIDVVNTSPSTMHWGMFATEVVVDSAALVV